MKSLLAILLAVVCISSVCPLENILNKSWQTYKKVFKKKYHAIENEITRRDIWEKNLQYVNKHNLEADMGFHTFWLGINEYADMENREFVQMMNTFIPRNLTTYKPQLTFVETDIKDLPDTVNWVDEGYATEVKNQGLCGSCWAFSATGSLEGQTFKKTGILTSLSEQNLIDCSSSYGNSGCRGGLMDNAFEYIKDNGGIDSEESYPYESQTNVCRFKKSDVAATVTGFVDVKSMREDSLQSVVAKIGPISVAIDASLTSFMLYKHGVYQDDRCSSRALNHGVLVVGYGTEDGKDYWLVKNSWGASWGLSGYIKMARNQNNVCGIASQASYPIV